MSLQLQEVKINTSLEIVLRKHSYIKVLDKNKLSQFQHCKTLEILFIFAALHTKALIFDKKIDSYITLTGISRWETNFNLELLLSWEYGYRNVKPCNQEGIANCKIYTPFSRPWNVFGRYLNGREKESKRNY